MTTVVVFPKAQVEVDGSDKTPLAVQTTLSLRSPVAIAQVRVKHTEGPFDGTEKVAIALGDQTGTIQQFAGDLNIDTISYGPAQLSFSAQGVLHRTQEATGIADPAALPVTDPADPPYQGPTFAKMWVTKTDGQIIKDILGAYGITDYDIEDSGNTFGTIEPVRWRSDQPGWALIEELDTITGYKTFDGPDGIVTRVPYSGLPGTAAAYQLTEGTNIRTIQRQRTTGKVYNKVVVNGKSGILAPTGEYYSISASRVGTSQYIPNPPGTQVYTFSSELIETEALAGICADRLLATLNRRTEVITVTITPGNKNIRPAMTVGVASPTMGLNADTLSRVLEVRQEFGSDYTTQVVLEGALGSEGTDPNQRPVAVVSYSIESEQTTSGAVWVVMLDGSASYDLDGYIVDYLWTASAGTITAIGDGETAVLILTGLWPATDPTVTLQVTDNQGKLGTKTIAIHKTNKNTFQRDLWAAVGNDLLFSRDGQNAWLTTGIAAYYIPEQAGDTYQLAATFAGVLYRVQTNLVYTMPPVINNVRCLFISRDRNGVETGTAWAGGSDGKLWVSRDSGVSWAQQGTIAAGQVIYAITESPYSPGDLYALCTNKIVHSYDAGVTWETLYTHPNPGVVANRYAAGITADDLNVHWAAFYGPTMVADASHIIEAENTINLDTANAADKPLRFTGLTISLDSKRLLLTDVSSGGNGRAWTGPADVSGNLTQKAAYVDATFGIPAHIIRDGKYPVVWGISDTKIWKSVDEFSSFLTVKSLSGGQVGQMIGYGKLHPPVTISGDLYYIGFSGTFGAEKKLIKLGVAGWSVVSDLSALIPTINGNDVYRLNKLVSGVMIARMYNPFMSPTDPSATVRSTDGGVTWTDISSALHHCVDLWQDDNGDLWAYGNIYAGTGGNHMKILHSTDDGATWTEVGDYLGFDGAVAVYTRLAVDLANPSVQVLQQFGRIAISTNGGVSFGTPVDPSGINRMDGNGGWQYPIFARSNNHVQNMSENTGFGSAGFATLRGGTISPVAMGVLPNAPHTNPGLGISEFTPLADGLIYAVGPATVWISADDGQTWSDLTATIGGGAYGGIAYDTETTDRYILHQNFVNPSLGVYTSMIARQNSSTGTPDDITQTQYDQLGTLYKPYAITAVK